MVSLLTPRTLERSIYSLIQGDQASLGTIIAQTGCVAVEAAGRTTGLAIKAPFVHAQCEEPGLTGFRLTQA